MQEAGATADIELGVHAGRRTGVSAYWSERRHERRRVRAPAVVLLGYRHEPLHGNRQDAGRPPALGQDREAIRPEKSQVARPAHAFADVAAGRSPSKTRSTTWPVRPSRRWAPRLGHTQSLHTNALDEAIALPTDFSARIARNTQIYIQEETYVTRSVDPWAGSYYVESLTNEIVHKAWELIQEVEKLGGMAKAIETGIPKMRIEEAAARKQARIDSGNDTIVGINRYRLEQEDPIDILAVDNTAVREAQIKRLKELRANRDEAKVRSALAAITECVKTKKGNLLELAVEAAKARASLRRDFRRLRGGRRALQGRDPLHLRRILSRSEKRQELRTSQGYGRAVR